MPAPTFVPMSPAMTEDRVVVGSSESGLMVGEAVAGTSNAGSMMIRASGTPTAAVSLSIALQRGGYSTGPYTEDTGTPGALFRWMVTGGSVWNGYNAGYLLTDVRTSYLASGTLDYYQVSELRQLQSGSLATVAIGTNVGTDTLYFLHRASRRSAWTRVIIATGVDVTVRPGWVEMPDARIVVYARSSTGLIDAWTSTDSGATWAVWSTSTHIEAGTITTICAQECRGSVCVVTGQSETVITADTTIYWSSDNGQGFASFGGDTGGLWRTPRLAVTLDGQAVLLVPVDTGAASCILYAYAVAYGGGISTGIDTGLTTDDDYAVHACATLDDGSIWIWSSTTKPAHTLEARMSLDGGATWHIPTSDLSAIDEVAATRDTSNGLRMLAAGAWRGALVQIATTSSTGTDDNSLMELWYGGYDDLTESGQAGANGGRQYAPPYGTGGTHLATDLPTAHGWTQTSVGAAGAAAITVDGVEITGDGAGNRRYVAPTAFWQPDAGDSWRIRWKTNVTSGGSIGSDTSYVMFAAGDGVNRQWIKVRYSSAQARVIDNSGTLATVSASMTGEVEWLLAWAHDYPAAGGGQASLWYRLASADTWVGVISAQAIAEEAGVATEVMEFGGSVAAAVVWAVQGPWWAPGDAQMDAGFTNPTDLAGRSLSPTNDVYVSSGVHLGARGDSGVAGDAWTLSTAYALGAVNLLRSLRPSCRAETTADAMIATYVIGDGSMPLVFDTFAVVGTNYRTATIEVSDAANWAAPSASQALDATVWSGVISASVAGLLTFAAGSFVPAAYRSTEGRKWYVMIGAAGASYEIQNNGDRGLYVAGLAGGQSGRAYIFGDRMAATFSPTTSMYVRLYIPTQETSSGTYRTGTPWLGMAAPISVLYDNGFVDRWVTPTTTATTARGYTTSAARGPEQHELRIAWAAIDRRTYGYLTELLHMLRSLDGNAQPILYWRDPSDIRTLGLYTVSGDPTEENITGEGRDAYSRLTQISLREYR